MLHLVLFTDLSVKGCLPFNVFLNYNFLDKAFLGSHCQVDIISASSNFLTQLYISIMDFFILSQVTIILYWSQPPTVILTLCNFYIPYSD